MRTPARTVRGRVAVAGVGETPYYKHGRPPEPGFALALRAILAACADAGLDPREVDGFASYSNDRNEPSRLAAALGLPELRFSNMQWGLALAEPRNLVDCFMWGNDYPHHEGTWPHSAEAIERTMGPLSDASRAKVLGLNAARFFGFRVP